MSEKEYVSKCSKIFLNEHRKADEIFYDMNTSLPISAVYFNPFYHDEKMKKEVLAGLNYLRYYMKENE